VAKFNNIIEQLFDRLGLSGTESVYFFEQKNKWNSIVQSETLKKIEKIQPDAFYVFNNQPYILFFDLSATHSREDREYEIHKQVWSFDQSPLIFIIKESEIEIFNAFAFNRKSKKLEQIKLKEGENIDELFSFWNLQSGSTWKWLQDNYYKRNIREKRVSQKLFENIRAVRETLITVNENPLIEDEANILILRLIFIRYLIDRNVKLDDKFISGSELN